MRVNVCLKPVPDPKHWNRLQLDPEQKTLVRSNVPMIINPLDRHALEAAIRLREAHGGEVIVISMAPPEARVVIQEALAMGADRAILLSDRAFAGSDTLATAYVLSEAVRDSGPFDVILCGDETIDGGTAHVSAQLAEYLGVANLMHVSAIEASSKDPWRVRIETEQATMLIEIEPPMVLSVSKAINTVRYVTMMNILEAETKEIQVKNSGDLNLDPGRVGLPGSPTRMAELFQPVSGKRAEFLSGDAAEQAASLADRLHRLGFF